MKTSSSLCTFQTNQTKRWHLRLVPETEPDWTEPPSGAKPNRPLEYVYSDILFITIRSHDNYELMCTYIGCFVKKWPAVVTNLGSLPALVPTCLSCPTEWIYLVYGSVACVACFALVALRRSPCVGRCGVGRSLLVVVGRWLISAMQS